MQYQDLREFIETLEAQGELVRIKAPVDANLEITEICRRAIATPKQIYFVTKLPKTRSGKIMRRLLKAIANNEKIGDVSTLEDSTAVTEVQSVFDEIQKSIKENSK